MTVQNSTTATQQPGRGRAVSSKAKRQKWRFALQQRVVIVTDLGRTGLVVKRSAQVYAPSPTHAYRVTKDHDGTTEWYPEFSLSAEGQDATSAPVEIMKYKCAAGHFHDSQSEAIDCDITGGAP
jgi:hypothetical protein